MAGVKRFELFATMSQFWRLVQLSIVAAHPKEISHEVVSLCLYELILADRQGFEPWELLSSVVFKTTAINQTLPPVHTYVFLFQRSWWKTSVTI